MKTNATRLAPSLLSTIIVPLLAGFAASGCGVEAPNETTPPALTDTSTTTTVDPGTGATTTTASTAVTTTTSAATTSSSTAVPTTSPATTGSTTTATTSTTTLTETVPTASTTTTTSTTPTETSSAPTTSEATTSATTTSSDTATETTTTETTTTETTTTETTTTETTDTDTGAVAPVDPSAGCGKANPQTGSSNSPLNASSHQYYVKLPSGYDANKPYKVMIMFNPTNNDINWAEGAAGYEQAAPDAIRVYPMMASKMSGWQSNETSFFQGLYDAITNNFCVDKARIFAGGESSGGEFAAYLGCEYGDVLRGVAPGAPKETGWAIDVTKHQCKGNPAAIVIWSNMDTVLVTNRAGSAFRDFYRDLNMCSNMSSPVNGYTDALSNCEEFSGCMDGSPVYFRQHNDPEYGTTYHGWAHFAAKMTWGVFSAF